MQSWTSLISLYATTAKLHHSDTVRRLDFACGMAAYTMIDRRRKEEKQFTILPMQSDLTYSALPYNEAA